MQHLETDTGSPGPYRDKENPTMSVHVPLMIDTAVSYNLWIFISKRNYVSCVQADDSRNVSSALAG